MVHRRQVSQESDGDGYCGENESDHIVAPEVGWLPGNLAAQSSGFQEYATGLRRPAREAGNSCSLKTAPVWPCRRSLSSIAAGQSRRPNPRLP